MDRRSVGFAALLVGIAVMIGNGFTARAFGQSSSAQSSTTQSHSTQPGAERSNSNTSSAQDDQFSASEVEATNPDFGVALNEEKGAVRIYARHSKGQLDGVTSAALVNQKWLRSSDYPKHDAAFALFSDALGKGRQLTLTNTGLAGQPDLIMIFRVHVQPAYAEMMVEVKNGTGKPINIGAARFLENEGSSAFSLDGPDAATRVLTGKLTDHPPAGAFQDLSRATANELTSQDAQLVYNEKSKVAFLAGATAAQEWATSLHLKVKQSAITGFLAEVAPAAGKSQGGLPVASGDVFDSPVLFFSLSPNYERALQNYSAARKAAAQSK
jgi:hypothetical protein